MPVLKVVKPRQSTAMERLVDEYLDWHRGKGHSNKTIVDAYGGPLRRLLLPFCAAEGVEEPSQLTDRHLNRLSAVLLEEGNPYSSRGQMPLSKHSVHSYMRALNSFLAWVKKEGEVVEAKAPLPRVGRSVVDVLSREEIQAMEDTATTERDKLIVRVLADTGIRLGELLGLKTADLVERDQRHVFLKVHGKGDKDRLVPLPPALAKRLRRYAEKTRRESSSDRIFLSSRRRGSGEYRPLMPSGLNQMIHNLAADAGINKRVYPHLLRHSYATHALRKGMSPLILQQILGHADLTMITGVYGHLDQDDAYTAMLALITSES